MVRVMSKKHTKQSPLFEAKASWFHVFNSMVETGDVAKMGPHTFTVYCIIKRYVNFEYGISFPKIETIAEDSGISERKVKSCVNELVSLGYVARTKKGRKNFYKLREKIPVYDKKSYEIEGEERQPDAIASWEYVPLKVRAATEELKDFIMTGSDDKFSIIRIDRLTVNIQEVHEGGHGNQYNLVQGDGPVWGREGLTQELVDSLPEGFVKLKCQEVLMNKENDKNPDSCC